MRQIKANRFSARLLSSTAIAISLFVVSQEVAYGAAVSVEPNQPVATASDSASPVTSNPAADVAPGDIVVTANRRAEPSQKVGISITALGAAALSERAIVRSEDLGKLVPGLNATPNTGASVGAFVIRGIGQSDFGDHEEQPVATYQDGVYIPTAAATGFPVFDLERVEVLRGPQGTLFGRNATGGLIQYVSIKPTSGISGNIEGAVGQRNLARIQGAFNVGNDKIANRLAVYHQSQDGFIKNTLGAVLGYRVTTAIRDQLLLKPTETTTITIRGEGFNQSGRPSGSKPVVSYFNAQGVAVPLPSDVDAYGTGAGLDPFGYRNTHSGNVDDLSYTGDVAKRVRSIAVTITQELGDAMLSSTTSYSHVYARYNENTAYLRTPVIKGAIHRAVAPD